MSLAGLERHLSPTPENIGAMAADAIESGGNSNGSWVKWSDGRLYQYGFAVLVTSDTGDITFEYPIPFVDTAPRPLISAMYSTVKDAVITYYAPTLTSFKVKCSRNDGTIINNLEQGISWLAIGRWK